MNPALLVVVSILVIQSSLAQVVNTNFPKQSVTPTKLPAKKNVWAFLMAGQSNMAGRGIVEASDTIPDARILTVNKNNEIVLAKEPLHYYEPTRTGLDCGLSFARTLLKSLPDDVSILLVPTAVGGSPIQRWLNDSTWRDIKLLSNAKDKIAIASKVGVFKGVLWHQGEANSNSPRDIEQHVARLAALVDTLRQVTHGPDLPFLMGELGSFSKNPEGFKRINQQLLAYSKTDKYSALINMEDQTHMGDFLHFGTEGQRRMGERFAEKYVSDFLKRSRRK